MKKFGPIRYLRGIAVSLVVSTLMPLLMVMTREIVEFKDSSAETVVRTSSCLCDGVSEKFIDTFYISGLPGLTWDVSFKPFDPQLVSVSEVVGGYKVVISSSYRKAYEISLVSSKNEYVTLIGGDCGSAVPIIQGLNSLCLSSKGAYSVQSQDNYTFSISSGGTLTNLGQNRVEINWGSITGTYTITAANITNTCMPDLKLDVTIGTAYTGVLACKSQINIGLDSTCETKVILSDVFIGQNTVGTALALVLKLKDGTIVPNNMLSKEYIGKEIVAHIVDGCGNNSCWGNVVLEDKMAPIIICSDSIEMECYNLQINSAVVAAEDCSNYTIHQVGGDKRTNLTCDPNYIARITRNFQARDQFGNTSAVCTVVMEIKRFPLDSVTFPTDLTDNISVDCNSLVGGTILPILSGYPKIKHLVLDKSNYPECNLLISYEDQIIKLPTKTKIIRTWEILEPHCNAMNRRTHKQLIEVSDRIAPVIAKCIDNINITTDTHQCLGIFKLPMIAAAAISDNCSRGFSHQIVITNFGTKNVGEVIALPLGDYAAQYIVSDESGNTATCNFSINVSDKTPPVAICKEFVVMSLSAGGGYISTAMINNGSKDECSLTSVLIRRMSDPNDRPYRDTIHVTCADVEKPFMVMLQATDQAGNKNTCMTTLTVQDKSLPILEVPSDRTITCAQWSANKDLKTYGEAIAFDQCNFTLEETVRYNLNNCQVGAIVRSFTARDATNSVVKTQTITVQNSTLADFSTIVAPRDTILTGMCDMKSLHPDSLAKYGKAYGRPILPTNSCVNLGITYKDEIYTVQSPANQNCFKVIRTWKIINWCEAPVNVYELKQTIAVENNIPPSITTPRNDTLFHTENCNAGDFSLSASGSDDCTPDDLLSWSWKVENHNNMTVSNGTAQGKNLNVVRSLPAGNYTFIWTLRDGCGNLREATHKFRIKYSKGASFFVVDTVAVALAPNDTSNSACITATPLVQSASHACGLSVKYSFSATNPNQDIICLDCKDLGYRAVTVYAHDANGVVTSARTIVNVQDNNKIRNCAKTNECVIWPRDTTINACVPNIRPQDIRSVPIINPNCNCTSTTTTFSDRPITSNTGECTVIERTHFVTFRCNGIITTFSEVQRINRRNATSPTLVCPQNTITSRSTSNCAAIVTIQGPTVSNTTCHTGLTTTYRIGTNPAQIGSSFTSSFNVGSTTVVFTVTDACGNSSTCSVNVEVTDGEAPICNVRDVTVFLNAQGQATITNPSIFDNGSRGACGSSSLSFAADRTQFNCSNLSNPVQVRLTVTGSNNQSTTCDAIVVVRDTVKPTLITRNIIKEISSINQMITVSKQELVAAASDNCSLGDTTLSRSQFTFQNLGVNNVTVILRDAQGNETRVVAIVNIVDRVPPTCNLRDVTIFVNNQGQATITDPTIFNAGLNTARYAVNRTIFSCTDIGQSNPVLVTITNDLGVSMICDANVIVRDTIKPQLTTRNITKEITSLNQVVSITKQELIQSASDNCTLGDTTLSISEFRCQNAGANTITVTLRDGSGNITTATAIVTIIDRVPPTCNLRDVTIFVNNQGQALISDASIFRAGAGVSCSDMDIVSYSVDKTTFNCGDIGRSNPVKVTVSDALGTSMICDANVIVRDTIKPQLTTRNITKEITSLNQVVSITKQELIQSAIDNCTLGDTTLSISEFRCQNAGENTVTVNLRDGSGNITTATAIVTIVDRVPPTCNLRDVTIFVNSQGQALISDASIFRAGAGASCSDLDIVSYAVDKTTFNCGDIGRSNPVKVTVSDVLGTSMICDANVIVRDTIKPQFTTRNITKEITSLNQVVSITKQELIQASSDNCTLGDTTLSISEFRCQNAGENNVTVTLRDGSGNITTATAIVTIIDRVPPTCNLRDVTIFLNNQGQALISDASIFRAGAGASCSDMDIVSYSVDKTTFNCGDIGRSNPVKVTVSDALGTSMICDANVIVRDTIKPQLTTRNITKEITSLNQVVSITKQELIQSASDNCTLGDTTLSISEFRCQNAGANTVTVTLRDGSGNTSTSTAIVTIVDRVPPTCNLRDVTIFVNSQGQALISDASIFRAGDGASCSGMTIISYTVDKTTFNCDDIGRSNPVKVTVRDALGNSMICDANVIVRDTLAPLVTPKNFELAITNNENVTIKKSDLITSITENCSVTDTIISKNSFTCENLGSNRVTVIAIDAFGNRDTVETTVTVIDRQAPICRVRNVSILLNAQGQATIGDASVFNSGSFDECNSIPLNFSVDKTQFTCTNLGANNPVMITVTDAAGNSSICPANVTVQDTIRPRLVVRNIQRTISNVNTSVVVNASDLIVSASDNCNIVDSANAPSIFTCANLGNNIVRVVVRDASGNTGIAEAIVTILDGVAPECRLKTATVMVNGGTTTIDSSTINNGSFDPCGTLATFKVSPNTFTCNDVGVRRVTATITDAAGNITICDTTITVVDGNQLICAPKDITVSLGANNTVTITANDVDGGSGTGCGNPVEKTINRTTFSCSDVGTPQNVILTITRPGTNQTSACTARVTVITQGVPSFICTVEKVDVACEEYDGINIPASVPRPRIANSCGGNFKLDSIIIRLPRNCNLDTMTRTYLLFDNNDNLLSTCVQSINIVNNKLLTIDSFDLPSTNITLASCADKRPEVTGGRMMVKQGVSLGCADIDISFRDTFLTNTCNDTLRRIWTAVDRCGSITPINFVQKIAIIDTFAPVITGVKDTILFNQGDCGVQINFTNIKVDDCDTRLTLTNNSPHARNNNGIDPSGFYPIGIYTIALSATDACNNSSQASFRVEIRDTSTQTFACRNVERIIQPTGIVSVNARELVGYFGNSCASTFNARVVMSRPGLDTVSSKVYTCDNLTLVGQELLKRDTLTIQVYSGNTLLHSCSAVLTIRGGGNCQNFFALKNNVRTITEEVVPNFSISLMSDGKELVKKMTDDKGQTTINAPQGIDMMIVPFKNDDHLNGVNTLDLVQMQRHILGISKFRSPYHMIAADVNNDKKVSISDIVEMRSLILGVKESFSNHTSWVAIDGSYSFASVDGALEEAYPQHLELDQINKDIDLNFVGVKIGDVDVSFTANAFQKNIQQRSKAIELALLDKNVKAEQTFEVELDLSQYNAIGAELIIALADAELLEISGKDWLYGQTSNQLKLINYNAQSLNKVNMKLRALQGGKISDFIEIESGEIYDNDLGKNKVKIAWNLENIVQKEIKVYPNPLHERATIAITSDEEEDTEYLITDHLGKVVIKNAIHINKGQNLIELNRSSLNGNGVYFLIMKVGGEQKSTKIIVTE